MPSVLPTLVEAIVLSSKSIKLRWTISYSPDREIIDGFFVGYRSFESSPPSSVPLDTQAQHHASSSSGSKQTVPTSAGEQPTFTYKTIRLTSRPGALVQESNGDNSPPANQRHQPSETGAAFLSPVASITKTIPAGGLFPGNSQSNMLHRHHPQASSSGQLSLVVSSFEYLIGSLERNTEYTILIQCFNKKGAGPTSDPVVFRTFMNGKSNWHFFARLYTTQCADI